MSEVIPNEIWLRILDFIPDNILFTLATLNHLFYDVAIGRRYHLLTLNSCFPDNLKYRFSRITLDTQIAARVRSLEIHPTDIHEFYFRLQRKGKYTPTQYSVTFKENADMLEDAKELFDVIACLTNLNSYTITSRSLSRPNTEFITSFLATVWSIISTSTTLRSLAIAMPIHIIPEVITTTSLKSLIYLTNFTLKLDNPFTNAQYSLTDLTSFLNHLSPSLRSLSLYITGHFDLSLFFATLKSFRQLRDLNLSIPCDPRHLSDPQGLVAFLDAHKMQLKSLSFSPHFCCAPRKSKNIPPESVDWESPAFSTLSFPVLHSLELRLNPFRRREEYNLCAPPKFTAAIAREKLGAREFLRDETGSQDIEKDPVPLTLSILGELILPEDVEKLLNPFSPLKTELIEIDRPLARIRVPETLILETHILSLNFVSFLSSTLPYLRNLSLTYTWIGSVGCYDERSLLRYLKRRTYPHWHLKNFTLKCTMNEEARRKRCEQSIRRAVPSLSQ